MSDEKKALPEVEDKVRYSCKGCSNDVYFDFRANGLDGLLDGEFSGLSVGEITVGGTVGALDFELSVTPCPHCGEAGKLCLESINLKLSAQF